MNKPSLRLQIPFITIIRTLINTTYRMVYPFLGVFRDSLGISLPALSIVLTIRSLLGMFSPFLASVSDSRGRKAGMLLGISLLVLGAGLVSIWPTYPALFMALLLTMLGKFAFDPSLLAYLGDQVPYQRRGFVVAVSEMGWSLSFIVGMPVVGFLIARSGWHSPFRWFTILGIIAMGVILWMVPNDSSRFRNGEPFLDNFKKILGYTPALAGIAMCIFFSAGNEVVNVIFGVWMEDVFGLKIAALGLASAVIGISELSGELSVVGFTDRLGKARAVSLGMVLNSGFALLMPFLAQNTWGALLGLFLFYISFEFTLVSSLPMLSEIVPASRATMMAFGAAAYSLGRAIGAPIAAAVYNMPWLTKFALSAIMGNVMVTIAFNFLAFFAVRILVNKLDLKG